MEDIRKLLVKKNEINEQILQAVKTRKAMLGSMVKTLRTQDGQTQEQLAETLNISRTQITNIESGKSGTTLEMVILLSECFLTHPSYLLGYNRPHGKKESRNA
jgi:transcriptional regulator with XRE-family HTH domain